MSDVGARIMGGMTKDEARAVLRKHGIKVNEGFDSENRVFEMYKNPKWKGKESQSDRVNYLLSQPGYKFLKKENGVVFLELTGTNGVKVTIAIDKKGVGRAVNEAKNDEKNSELKALYKKKIYDVLNKAGGSSAKKNDVMAKIELREKTHIIGNAPDREAFNAAWDELKSSKEVEKKLAVTMI
jgi:hypothetical protein